MKKIENIFKLPLLFFKEIVLRILFCVFKIGPIKKDKIIFINYDGRGYGDNGKYIYKQLINEESIDCYWVVNDIGVELPKKIKKIKNKTILFYYHIFSAKVIINNARFPRYIIKRKAQYYIQTWHGDLQIKKIEWDAKSVLGYGYRRAMKTDTAMTDLMLSNSDHFTKICRKAFRYSGEVMEVGSPRDDILLDRPKDVVFQVRSYFSIKENENILLYAPTFRENYKHNPYDIDFDRLKTKLLQVTGKKWKILIRLHPNIKNPERLIKKNKNIIDANKYADIQELIVSCNLLITDYSSVMFDAMIAEKPVIIYAKDADDYINTRGCYFSLSELPFLTVKNNSDLNTNLNSDFLKKYQHGYNGFKKKIGLKETGISGKLVADKIMNIVGEDK